MAAMVSHLRTIGYEGVVLERYRRAQPAHIPLGRAVATKLLSDHGRKP
jgi:hypothetical protein